METKRIKRKRLAVEFEARIWRNVHRGVLAALIHQHGEKVPVTLACEPSNGVDHEAIALLSPLDAFVVGGDPCGDMRRIGYIRQTETTSSGEIINPRKSELFKYIDAIGGKLDSHLVFVLKVDIGCYVHLMTDVELRDDEFDDEIDF